MIENAIVALLIAADTVAADRIYPMTLPDNDPQLPAIVHQRVSGTRELDHSGDQGYAEARVQLSCYAQTTTGVHGFDQARDLAEQVRLALNGFRGAVAGVDVGRIQVTGDRANWDPERTFDRWTVDALCAFQEEQAA
jgi:Protein of unknown function (DUF3168)